MIPLVYDQLNQSTYDTQFFCTLLKKANAKVVADLGCGTGQLTEQFVKEGYQITAIDPNQEALERARKKEIQGSVEWILGDSSELKHHTYDVVIMTSNVAQVFLTSDSWKQMLLDVYRALKPGGHLIFDVRNPLAKVWEEWEQDLSPDYAKHPQSGDDLEILTEYEGFTEDVFTFYESVKHVPSGEILQRERLQLRFQPKEEIDLSLKQVGFDEVHTFGDWQFAPATSQSKTLIYMYVKK
ncbi:class I SAM-dependent methyltransferase [Alkalicoccobacillus gibsonii]|uniref:class I SAM-dependent methyltransferase n=1 Tax=Alkalicoccobacillus gibsonii TaxID=79881 RepID=UPI003F7C2F78